MKEIFSKACFFTFNIKKRYMIKISAIIFQIVFVVVLVISICVPLIFPLLHEPCVDIDLNSEYDCIFL